MQNNIPEKALRQIVLRYRGYFYDAETGPY